MIFDKETKEMICDHEKDVTRRLYNPKRRPAIPGKRHKIKIDRTLMVYGEIEILSCKPQRWGDLTEEDAKREGFPKKATYKEYFYATNGLINDDDLVWVVEFKTIWTNRKGVMYMKNFSNEEHVCYDECRKGCIHTYGKHKDCLQCNYYIENEYEKEIANFEKQQNQALDRCLSRLEDGELL